MLYFFHIWWQFIMAFTHSVHKNSNALKIGFQTKHFMGKYSIDRSETWALWPCAQRGGWDLGGPPDRPPCCTDIRGDREGLRLPVQSAVHLTTSLLFVYWALFLSSPLLGSVQALCFWFLRFFRPGGVLSNDKDFPGKFWEHPPLFSSFSPEWGVWSQLDLWPALRSWTSLLSLWSSFPICKMGVGMKP